MFRLLRVLWILPLLVPSLSFASLTWLDVHSASLDGWGSAWEYDEYGYRYEDSDTGGAHYPGSPMPIHINASAQVPHSFAYCSGVVNPVAIDLSLDDYDSGWPYERSSDAFVHGELRRAFRLDDGVGSTSVSIPFRLIGSYFGDAPFGLWSAGVSGISTLQGYHDGYIGRHFNEMHNWTGTLDYGHVYEFVMNLSGFGAGGPESAYLDYRAELQAPVPEPASLVLLVAGIGTAGLCCGRTGPRKRRTAAGGGTVTSDSSGSGRP